ncbi:theronine dehydrogenase [Klebsiella pneumoniae]
MKWRYSLRWKLPHRPCPGPRELISVVVEAGQAAPEEVMSRWVAGSGYAVCVDFLGQKQIQRWSDERKAAVRRRNMQARIKEGANIFFVWGIGYKLAFWGQHDPKEGANKLTR